MRKCPHCNKKMALAIRWSHSKRRLQIIYKCRNCRIWDYPKSFK